MKIDIHSHLLNPNYDFNKLKNFYEILLLKHLGIKSFDEFLTKIKKDINNSDIDKAVLIGIENSHLSANNKQVYEICQNNNDFLYGANLNPYSENIDNEIKEEVEKGCVLVKVIPSYQDVNLNDNRCIPFYAALKQHNLPLLVHTGNEHILRKRHDNQKLNNPMNIELGAKIGVNIICAHCGVNMYFHEKSYFNEWVYLATKYENIYGDISGMISPIRNHYLKKILNKNLINKICFGTDYPAIPVKFFSKTDKNIYNSWYKEFKKMGFSDIIFFNNRRLLNYE